MTKIPRRFSSLLWTLAIQSHRETTVENASLLASPRWRGGNGTLDWLAKTKVDDCTDRPSDSRRDASPSEEKRERARLSHRTHRAFNLAHLEWHHIIRYVLLLLVLRPL